MQQFAVLCIFKRPLKEFSPNIHRLYKQKQEIPAHIIYL